jgi:hypothetical protein
MARAKLLQRGNSVYFCAQSWRVRHINEGFAAFRQSGLRGVNTSRSTDMRLFLVLCLALFTTSLQAQTMPCAPRAHVLDMLAKAEQTRRAVGHAGQAVMETFASDAGDWTITISLPDGRMCLLANGQDYTARDELFPASGTAL